MITSRELRMSTSRHRAGYAVLKCPVAQKSRAIDAAEAQECRAFVVFATVEAGLVNGAERLLDLVGRETRRIEAGNDASKACPGDGTDAKALPLQKAQNPNVRISLGSAATQCKRDIHVLALAGGRERAATMDYTLRPHSPS
jgi:hypothetical protein